MPQIPTRDFPRESRGLTAAEDATDVKFAPVRGDKSDVRLEEMFKQIIERVEDLQESLTVLFRIPDAFSG